MVDIVSPFHFELLILVKSLVDKVSPFHFEQTHLGKTKANVESPYWIWSHISETLDKTEFTHIMNSFASTERIQYIQAQVIDHRKNQLSLKEQNRTIVKRLEEQDQKLVFNYEMMKDSFKNQESLRKEVVNLKVIVATLEEKLGSLQLVTAKRCVACDAIIQSQNPSHLKCEKCYLTRQSRSCSRCFSSYTPVHFSHKMCPTCHSAKQTNKTGNKTIKSKIVVPS